MPTIDYSSIHRFRKVWNNIIDAVALVAALSWLGVMIGLAWSSKVSLLTALQRGLVGSILVYATVFAGLRTMVRMANRTAEKERKKLLEASPGSIEGLPRERVPDAAQEQEQV